ncbi:MAG: creatininase family protein [Candidatus Lokiarchaeota archaeon]|nr:creatininase family protein [Candidatus Lokiarchaeota archaeon]
MIRIITDTIRSLSYHGLKRILIVNFHGGNTDILNFTVKKLVENINIITNNLENQDPFTTLKNFDIHAGKEETLFMLNLFPELVDKDKMIEWKPTTNFPKTIA